MPVVLRSVSARHQHTHRYDRSARCDGQQDYTLDPTEYRIPVLTADISP